MYIKIKKDNWKEIKYKVINQKDYDFLEKNNIFIFIYGYPFLPSKGTWLTKEDIYKFYLSKNMSFVKDIEGVYTLIIIDRIKEKCLIITDRYGIYSLFYFKNDYFINISDSVLEISKDIKFELNQESIIEYLNFGFKIGNKTHISNIYQFGAAKIYSMDSKLSFTKKTYWFFLDKLNNNKIPNDKFCEIFNEHIKTAFKLENLISLPLTGGLDTRTILSACLPKKEKLHCYTHGIKNNSDIKLAKKICGYFDIKYDFYELNLEWINNIPKNCKEESKTLNGLIPFLQWLHIGRSYRKEQSKGGLIISGVLGNEIWRSFLGNVCKNAQNIEELSEIIIERITNKRNYNIFKEKNLKNKLIKSVKNEISEKKYVDFNPVNLSEYFVFKNYCSNWAANSIKYCGKYFKIFVAFLQKDLLQQNVLIDLNKKTNGFIQKYIISKNSNYLKKLLLGTGKTIDSDLIMKIKGYLLMFCKYSILAINKISRKIIKKSIFKIPYFTNYPDWLRNKHKDFVLDVLSFEKMYTKNIFKRDELEKRIQLFLNGDNSSVQFIIRLISLELWLKNLK